MSASPPKADMCGAYVCFWAKSGLMQRSKQHWRPIICEYRPSARSSRKKHGREVCSARAPPAATTSLEKQSSPSSLGMVREVVRRSLLEQKVRQGSKLPGDFLPLLLPTH